MRTRANLHKTPTLFILLFALILQPLTNLNAQLFENNEASNETNQEEIILDFGALREFEVSGTLVENNRLRQEVLQGKIISFASNDQNESYLVQTDDKRLLFFHLASANVSSSNRIRTGTGTETEIIEISARENQLLAQVFQDLYLFKGEDSNYSILNLGNSQFLEYPLDFDMDFDKGAHRYRYQRFSESFSCFDHRGNIIRLEPTGTVTLKSFTTENELQWQLPQRDFLGLVLLAQSFIIHSRTEIFYFSYDGQIFARHQTRKPIEAVYPWERGLIISYGDSSLSLLSDGSEHNLGRISENWNATDISIVSLVPSRGESVPIVLHLGERAIDIRALSSDASRPLEDQRIIWSREPWKILNTQLFKNYLLTFENSWEHRAYQISGLVFPSDSYYVRTIKTSDDLGSELRLSSNSSSLEYSFISDLLEDNTLDSLEILMDHIREQLNSGRLKGRIYLYEDALLDIIERLGFFPEYRQAQIDIYSLRLEAQELLTGFISYFGQFSLLKNLQYEFEPSFLERVVLTNTSLNYGLLWNHQDALYQAITRIGPERLSESFWKNLYDHFVALPQQISQSSENLSDLDSFIPLNESFFQLLFIMNTNVNERQLLLEQSIN